MQIDIDLSLGKQSPVAPFSVDEGPFYAPPGPPEHVEGPLSKGPRLLVKKYLQLIKYDLTDESHSQRENLVKNNSNTTPED